jgi:hypothetical protein
VARVAEQELLPRGVERDVGHDRHQLTDALRGRHPAHGRAEPRRVGAARRAAGRRCDPHARERDRDRHRQGRDHLRGLRGLDGLVGRALVLRALGVEATQELEEVVAAEPAPELAAQLLDRGAPVGDVAAPRFAVLVEERLGEVGGLAQRAADVIVAVEVGQDLGELPALDDHQPALAVQRQLLGLDRQRLSLVAVELAALGVGLEGRPAPPEGRTGARRMLPHRAQERVTLGGGVEGGLGGVELPVLVRHVGAAAGRDLARARLARGRQRVGQGLDRGARAVARRGGRHLDQSRRDRAHLRELIFDRAAGAVRRGLGRRRVGIDQRLRPGLGLARGLAQRRRLGRAGAAQRHDRALELFGRELGPGAHSPGVHLAHRRGRRRDHTADALPEGRRDPLERRMGVVVARADRADHHVGVLEHRAHRRRLARARRLLLMHRRRQAIEGLLQPPRTARR